MKISILVYLFIFLTRRHTQKGLWTTAARWIQSLRYSAPGFGGVVVVNKDLCLTGVPSINNLAYPPPNPTSLEPPPYTPPLSHRRAQKLLCFPSSLGTESTCRRPANLSQFMFYLLYARINFFPRFPESERKSNFATQQYTVKLYYFVFGVFVCK